MVNLGESLVNVVTQNKPKVLIGLDQKVDGQVQVFFAHLSQSLHHQQIGGTYPLQVFKWNVVSSYFSWKSGKRTVR